MFAYNHMYKKNLKKCRIQNDDFEFSNLFWLHTVNSGVLTHKCTLVEYSTIVKYSENSKLDFHFQNFSFRILFIDFKMIHNECRNQKMMQGFYRRNFFGDLKISVFDDIFRPPNSKDPPSADILKRSTNIL